MNNKIKLHIAALGVAFKTLAALSKLQPQLAAVAAIQIWAIPIRFPRPGWEVENLKKSQQKTFKNGLKGQIWGRGDKTALLVHGWNGRGTQMSSLLNMLLEKNFRVVAFDGPAHGDSPGLYLDPAYYAKTITEIAEEVGGIHTLIGHSFGAACSALAVSQGLEVEKLVLIASPYAYVRVILRFCEKIGVPPSAQEAFLNEIKRRVGIDPRDFSLPKVLSHFQKNTLLIHDTEDEDIPVSDARDVVREMPDIHYLETQKLGHRRVLKDKQVLAAISEFLK